MQQVSKLVSQLGYRNCHSTPKHGEMFQPWAGGECMQTDVLNQEPKMTYFGRHPRNKYRRSDPQHHLPCVCRWTSDRASSWMAIKGIKFPFARREESPCLLWEAFLNQGMLGRGVLFDPSDMLSHQAEVALLDSAHPDNQWA